MKKSTAFAVATMQSHATGKTPKDFGTKEGKREAKAKFDKPKKEYVKTPNPGNLDSPKLASMMFASMGEELQKEALGNLLSGLFGGGGAAAVAKATKSLIPATGVVKGGTLPFLSRFRTTASQFKPSFTGFAKSSSVGELQKEALGMPATFMGKRLLQGVGIGALGGAAAGAAAGGEGGRLKGALTGAAGGAALGAAGGYAIPRVQAHMRAGKSLGRAGMDVGGQATQDIRAGAAKGLRSASERLQPMSGVKERAARAASAPAFNKQVRLLAAVPSRAVSRPLATTVRTSARARPVPSAQAMPFLPKAASAVDLSSIAEAGQSLDKNLEGLGINIDKQRSVGSLRRLLEHFKEKKSSAAGSPYLLDKLHVEPKIRPMRADAPKAEFRVKQAFTESQYSGGTGEGPLRNYESHIPPFVNPPIKTSGPPSEDQGKRKSKTAAMVDELCKLNAVTSPLSQLTKVQKIGAPKASAPPGPSIQQVAKPMGFGRPQPGATKSGAI